MKLTGSYLAIVIRQALMARQHGFTMSDHSIYIYGLCGNCQS